MTSKYWVILKSLESGRLFEDPSVQIWDFHFEKEIEKIKALWSRGCKSSPYSENVDSVISETRTMSNVVSEKLFSH